MANANIQILHDEWQRAVEAHAAMIWNGRLSGLSGRELDELGRAYVLRIDAAFMRLKEAETKQQPSTVTLFK